MPFNKYSAGLLTDRKEAYPSLALVIQETYFEKTIPLLIDEILDEYGTVKDSASDKLADIRMALYKKRVELKKVFGAHRKQTKQAWISYRY